MLPVFRYQFFCIVLFCACGNGVSADTQKEHIPGVTTVVAEDLLALINEKPELLIIDSRIPMDRQHGYIEGSLSLPDTETHCRALAKLITKTQTPVLFYCNGVNCGRSESAAKIAVICGYKEVYWFRGGFVEWKAKQLPYLKK